MSTTNGKMRVGSSLRRGTDGRDKDFLDQCVCNVVLSLQTLFHGLLWGLWRSPDRDVSSTPSLHRQLMFGLTASDSASALNLVLHPMTPAPVS